MTFSSYAVQYKDDQEGRWCAARVWAGDAHLIRPSKGMSRVFPLATKEGKECSMWTRMSM